MNGTTENPKSRSILERRDFPTLFQALKSRGYEIVGPTVRDQAIIYQTLESADDLPAGWTDEQKAGTYRLRPRTDQALFGYAVGPHSWKKYLFLPEQRLFRARRDSSGGVEFLPEAEVPRKLAFLGVRACELQALAIQDRVFMEGPAVDPTYRSRRENAFIVAVNCVEPGGTCFCVSMKTGPRASGGFDLALTEVAAAERHYFLAETGTPAGESVLAELAHRRAREEEERAADQAVEEAANRMGRVLDTDGLKEILYDRFEDPHWDEVANRCLSCANCTLVCPTCFCSTVEDVTDLTGQEAERWRKWDSCFTMDFSHLAGGSVRQSTRSRYRQWLTHKLATWIDQFGVSGCVGCGRCITWCPVGIDLTEEVASLRRGPVSFPAREEGDITRTTQNRL
jgi:ferredoxin